MKKEILKSILAGICIGIAGYINLNINNSIIGAILFSLGLYTICTYNLNLFTGKVGYLSFQDTPYKYILFLFRIFIFNLVGCFIISRLGLFSQEAIEKLKTIIELKQSSSVLSSFIKSFLCGILMFIAVDGYKETKNPLFLILCVSGFILSGMEHSIANAYYYFVSGLFSIKLLIYSIGNAIGGIFASLLKYSNN